MRKQVIKFLANAAAKGFDLSKYIEDDKLDLDSAEIDAEDFLIKNTPLEEKIMCECALTAESAAGNQYYHYSDDDVEEEVGGEIFDFSARYKAEDNTLYEVRIDSEGNYAFRAINDFEIKRDNTPEEVYGYAFVFAEVVQSDAKVLRLFDFLQY